MGMRGRGRSGKEKVEESLVKGGRGEHKGEKEADCDVVR